MALLDDFDVKALHTAHLKIKELEAAAIERARLYLETEGMPFQTFHNADGWTVRVLTESLLDSNYVDVTFYHRDAQGGGNATAITIPRSVILGDLTKDEQEMLEFKRLKEKFEKK